MLRTSVDLSEPERTPDSPVRAPVRCALAAPVALPQHADEHRPERPVLLAVDQELGEGPRLRVPQYEPIASARSKSGSIRTWSSSARGTWPSTSRRCRRRSSLSGPHDSED
jgi:hypothetical protein